MNNEAALKDYTMKVNKVYTCIFGAGAVSTLISCIMSIFSYVPFAAIFGGTVISAILIARRSSEKTIMYVLLFSSTIFYNSIILERPQFGMVAFLALAVSTLYFHKWFNLLNCVTICITMTYHFFQHTSNLEEYGLQIACLIVTAVILFYLSKWGVELIQKAGEKEQHAKALLEDLEKTMEVIKRSTFTLNSDINECNNGIAAVHEISESVAAAIQEITKGVMGQTESVSKISEMMSEADQRVAEINQFSKQLSDISAKTSHVVSEDSQKIIQMENQMDIINQASIRSISNVQELNKNMDEVNKFLLGITQIAEQTNLLALNAAIEAARAGESGRGFTVVADEVRKLAEQSANTVGQISQITNQVREKTDNVLNDVYKVGEATQEGSVIASRVNEGFKRIQASFEEIDEYISEELVKIENTAFLFSKIHEETESIASISTEHAASTEELMATVEEHNANIENINILMHGIKVSSDALKGIIKD